NLYTNDYELLFDITHQYKIKKFSEVILVMIGEKAQAVKALIQTDAEAIFSKTYSKLAKNISDELKKSYTDIQLDARDDGDEILAVLSYITGARTVPRVL
ncbi:hypothetical protein WA026_001011, partial [Henosepilachna vigintioctopunctata]